MQARAQLHACLRCVRANIHTYIIYVSMRMLAYPITPHMYSPIGFQCLHVCVCVHGFEKWPVVKYENMSVFLRRRTLGTLMGLTPDTLCAA